MGCPQFGLKKREGGTLEPPSEDVGAAAVLVAGHDRLLLGHLHVARGLVHARVKGDIVGRPVALREVAGLIVPAFP